MSLDWINFETVKLLHNIQLNDKNLTWCNKPRKDEKFMQ